MATYHPRLNDLKQHQVVNLHFGDQGFGGYLYWVGLTLGLVAILVAGVWDIVVFTKSVLYWADLMGQRRNS